VSFGSVVIIAILGILIFLGIVFKVNIDVSPASRR
jgi:hypothetical protein